MSNTDNNNWNRREFILGIGATTAGMALSSCAISGDRSAIGLTEEALAITHISHFNLKYKEITVKIKVKSQDN